MGFFEADCLGFEVEFGEAGEELGVDAVAASHGEAPLVLDLAAHVQVELSNEQAVAGAGKGRGPRSVRGSDVTAAVKVPELMMGFLSVAAGELVGVYLSSHTVDSHCEIMVGDSSISRLYSPKGLRESVDGG